MICWGQAAMAEPILLPGIGAGVRHNVDVSKNPWRILGRVQTELGTRCTGFLVAPSVIETAAHCLWLPQTEHYVQPSSVHFLLGYDAGDFRATARGVRIIIPPGYDPHYEIRTGQADHATIILDHPVVSNREILPLIAPSVGQQAMLAGYEQDRGEIAFGDVHCRITAIRGRLLDHDCAATHGASGAPLLLLGPQGWGIGGIDIWAQAEKGGTAIRVSD
ncbi:hypothetical protein A0U90_02845 [Kozakia baliensis]|nr:hypothetical protein A0U90_02845 [Kozakia baliensis]